MSEMQSLARGLRILDVIANADRGITITEIAAILEIDKSSASRLVKTLVNYDYLQPDTASRGYLLGRRMRQISWQLLNKMPVREKAKPYLLRLMRETGECSHTAIYSEGKALVIDDVEAEEAALRVVGRTGRLIPLYCTAVGKAILAFSELPIPAPLEQITLHTITDRHMLLHHLELVRQQGYAYDDEEHEDGVRCIAAPVQDNAGVTIGSIGISGPKVRISDDRVALIAQTVIRAAQELSTELGYRARVNGVRRKASGRV